MIVPSIAILIGSLQEAGLTRKVANALRQLGEGRATFATIEIGDLPLYNPEREAEGMPEWEAFRAAVAPLDGVLFVTPEYNRSVPAALKNAIDVGSRPYGQSVWSGKPAGIVSQSPGAMGGFGANHHLRQSLVFLDMPAMAQPEAYIGQAGTLFDEDGSLIEGPSKAFLESYMVALVRWVSQHAKPRG